LDWIVDLNQEEKIKYSLNESNISGCPDWFIL